MNTSVYDAGTEAPTATRQVAIDFLYLDLDTCDRCRGTDTNLDTALNEVAQLLQAADIQVTVRKTLVAAEAQARELGFVSSPTLRVNGQDIAVELRESRCDAEACACNGSIDCRVWTWQGEEYTEAPTPMIVDAILREIYRGSDRPAAEPVPVDVPENLKRFFSIKREQPSSQAAGTTCCSPPEQATCCEPSAKASCCDAAPAGSCGCT